MKRRLLLAATAVSLMGALGQSAAGASPAPDYTVSCVRGDTTVLTWQHVKGVDQVTFEWFASGSTTAFEQLVSPVPPLKPPHGSITAGTPTDQATGLGPATVTVSIRHGGVTDQITGICT